MAGLKPGEKEVNRTCVYVDSTGRLRPGVITALGAGDLVDLRVGHHGETYSAVPLMVNSDDVSVWYYATRRRFVHS